MLKMWDAIDHAYTEYIRSRLMGLDLVTLILLKPDNSLLWDIKTFVADMICFFAAGKLGLERQAEDMAWACLNGGK